MNPITRLFSGLKPRVVLREKRTPDAQLNSALLALRGPALEAVDELLSTAIVDQWAGAGDARDDRTMLEAVAGARALVDFKAALSRRIYAAEAERKKRQAQNAR